MQVTLPVYINVTQLHQEEREHFKKARLEERHQYEEERQQERERQTEDSTKN